MNSRSTGRAAGTIAAAGAMSVALFAGSAGAATPEIHGTVVHRNSRAHSFVVATHNGTLYAVHAAHAPALGSVVSVGVRELRNGTFAATSARVHAHARRTARLRVRGIVSYVNHRSGTYTLSTRGVSMIVTPQRVGARRAFDTTSGSLPAVGDPVTATGQVNDQGEMEDASTQLDGQPTSTFDLEGTVLSVDTTASTITVSSDDEDNAASAPIVVSVPTGLSTASFTPGEEVELQVSLQNGQYVLGYSASDEGAQAAQNGEDSQGTQDNQGENEDGPGYSSGDGSSTTTTSTTASATTTSSDASAGGGSDN